MVAGAVLAFVLDFLLVSFSSISLSFPVPSNIRFRFGLYRRLCCRWSLSLLSPSLPRRCLLCYLQDLFCGKDSPSLSPSLSPDPHHEQDGSGGMRSPQASVYFPHQPSPGGQRPRKSSGLAPADGRGSLSRRGSSGVDEATERLSNMRV